jgi:hypothetical protein
VGGDRRQNVSGRRRLRLSDSFSTDGRLIFQLSTRDFHLSDNKYTQYFTVKTVKPSNDYKYTKVFLYKKYLVVEIIVLILRLEK